MIARHSNHLTTNSYQVGKPHPKKRLLPIRISELLDLVESQFFLKLQVIIQVDRSVLAKNRNLVLPDVNGYGGGVKTADSSRLFRLDLHRSQVILVLHKYNPVLPELRMRNLIGANVVGGYVRCLYF
jgi:hypothetical protein